MTQSNFFTRFKLLYNENNLDDLNKNFNEIRKHESKSSLNNDRFSQIKFGAPNTF